MSHNPTLWIKGARNSLEETRDALSNNATLKNNRTNDALAEQMIQNDGELVVLRRRWEVSV